VAQALSNKPGRPKIELSKQVLEEYYVTQGLSVRAIAQRFGISHQTVAQRIRDNNLPVKRWRFPGES
jgi:transposase